MSIESERRAARAAVEQTTAKMEAVTRKIRSLVTWYEPGYYTEGAEYEIKSQLTRALSEIADALDEAFGFDSNSKEVP